VSKSILKVEELKKKYCNLNNEHLDVIKQELRQLKIDVKQERLQRSKNIEAWRQDEIDQFKSLNIFNEFLFLRENELVLRVPKIIAVVKDKIRNNICILMEKKLPDIHNLMVLCKDVSTSISLCKYLCVSYFMNDSDDSEDDTQNDEEETKVYPIVKLKPNQIAEERMKQK